MQSVTNCWVRDVRVIDADNGVHMTQCDLVTVEKFSMEVGAEGLVGAGQGLVGAEVLGRGWRWVLVRALQVPGRR